MTSHIILLEPGMWIAEVGSTMVRSNARIFDSKADAEATLARARENRPYLLARIIRVVDRTNQKKAHTGEWNLDEAELERRKAEAREWQRQRVGDRGKSPVEQSGIREVKLDRRRNGLNF